MNKKKIIALTITASMLLGSTVFAQSLTNEGPLKVVPISAGLKQNVGTRAFIFERTVKEENEYVKVDAKLPLILGMKDWKYTMQLNNLLMSQATKDQKDIEEQIIKQSELAKEKGWTFRPGELIIKYEVKNNNDILSFAVTTYMYAGGANGQTRVDTYNIDLKDEKNLNLSDLFKSSTDFKSAINNEISTQIEAENQVGKQFFKDDMGFKTISDNQNFFIKDDNLVILFQKYAIAPGTMGTPEFIIPLQSLNSILKNPQPSKSEGKLKQYNLSSFTGTVKGISASQANESRKFVSVENEAGEKATLVVTDNTYFVNNAQIAEGTVITGLYDAIGPMIMIYPPQYNAEVVTLAEKGQNIKVDIFGENLISSDKWLKLNISKETEIISQDGKAFDGDLKNRKLVVIYSVTTKSIPAQTTPTKIIVLNEKNNSN